METVIDQKLRKKGIALDTAWNRANDSRYDV